jgi:hypothetical protein
MRWMEITSYFPDYRLWKTNAWDKPGVAFGCRIMRIFMIFLFSPLLSRSPGIGFTDLLSN